MVELQGTQFAVEMQLLIDFHLDVDVRARFFNEGVTYSLFDYLTESDQCELMPKLVDRLHFRKGLAVFKKINESTTAPESSCNEKDDNDQSIVICIIL